METGVKTPPRQRGSTSNFCMIGEQKRAFPSSSFFVFANSQVALPPQLLDELSRGNFRCFFSQALSFPRVTTCSCERGYREESAVSTKTHECRLWPHSLRCRLRGKTESSAAELCIKGALSSNSHADELTRMRGLRFVRRYASCSQATSCNKGRCLQVATATSSPRTEANAPCALSCQGKASCRQQRQHLHSRVDMNDSSSGSSNLYSSSSNSSSSSSSNSSSNSSNSSNSSSSCSSDSYSSSCNSSISDSSSSSSRRVCDGVYRGYRFDRMLETKNADPSSTAALEALAMCTLKTVVLPAAVLQKLHLLLKYVGRKKDLEKTGRLLADKTTARTSVELPRILPSQLLPDAQQIAAAAAAAAASAAAGAEEDGQHPQEPAAAAAAAAAAVGRSRGATTASSLFLRDRDTRLLRSLPGARETILSSLPPDGLEAQEALAAAEDARHPLYRHLVNAHSPLTAAAYTAHRFAGVYASLLRILTEVKGRCPHFFPSRVLEMNAGFAAGLLAVDAVYGQLATEPEVIPSKQGKSGKDFLSLTTSPKTAEKKKIEFLMAVEPSGHLASVGRFLTADLRPHVQWQLGLYEEGLRRKQSSNNLSPVSNSLTAAATTRTTTAAAAAAEEGGRGGGGGSDGDDVSDDRFDLILLPHVLLRSVDGQASRHSFLRDLWKRLKPGGLMVLLERGTVTGFRVLASVRELFICELGIDKFHFVSPCPHEAACPLALTGRDWCHFGQRVRRVPHHLYCKGSRAKSIEEEKFSFLVVGKGPGPRLKYPSLAAAEAAAASAADQSFFWPRLVAPPIKAREHVLLDVCAAPHHFERIAVSKHMPHAAGYKPARHAAWGDLWNFPRKIIRPDARAYMQQDVREALEERHKQRVRENQKNEIGNEEEREELEQSLVRHFGA
ncbi:hypothetical protein Emed_001140 [Eimeria media]